MGRTEHSLKSGKSMEMRKITSETIGCTCANMSQKVISAHLRSASECLYMQQIDSPDHFKAFIS